MLELTACHVDLARGVVVRGVDTIALTTREADLLRYLASNPARVIARDELLGRVWGYSDSVVSRACDNAVRRLREKIEADVAHPDHILTVFGSGYRFAGPGQIEVAPAPPPRVVVLGDVRVDLERLRVQRGHEPAVALPPAHGAVLDALVAADGRALDRQDLGRAGWGRTRAASRVVAVAIHQLRRLIEPDPANPTVLLSSRGGGYKLVPPPRSAARSDMLGRERELADVSQALAESPWVLLLGPAGIGKSTLARAAADRSVGAVVEVSLASAASVDQAAQLVARALQIDLGRTDPVDRVTEALAERRPELLVLDNLDSLDARAAIDAWLATGARLLGTSRRRLGATGERVVELGPLGLEPAIALFVRRARAATSVNAGIADHQAAIGALVDRLERVPLAIELAAARTSTLGVADLLEHLHLGLLASPHGPERHRSLAAVIDTTLDALPPALAAALSDLVLFRAGFFVDDAHGVLGDEAIDLVQGLRDHSVLAAVPRGPVLRFAVWEAIRERLDQRRAPTVNQLRRNAAWLARWGEDATFDRLGFAGSEPIVERMRAQVEDLAAAARSAAAIGEPVLAARCALAAGWVYAGYGPFALGLTVVDAALGPNVPGALRARLLVVRDRLARELGLERKAGLVEAVALAAEHGDPRTEIRALDALSELVYVAGDRARAAEAVLRAAELAPPGSGIAEKMLGRQAILRGESPADLFEAAAARADAAGDVLLAAEIGIEVAELKLRRRSPAAAERAYHGYLRFGLRAAAAVAAGALGELAMIARDRTTLDRWVAVTRELATQIDSPRIRWQVVAMTGWSHLLGGEIAEATAANHAAIAMLDTPETRVSHELLWIEIARCRRDPRLIERHTSRLAERYRSLDIPWHAAAIQAKAVAAWLEAGDLPRARALLDASRAPDETPDRKGFRLAARAAAEALVARAEGDPGADALFAELATLLEDPPADEGDRVARALWDLPFG